MAGAVIGAQQECVSRSSGLYCIRTYSGLDVASWSSCRSLFDNRSPMGFIKFTNLFTWATSNTKSQLIPIPIIYGKCRVGGNIIIQTS